MKRMFLGILVCWAIAAPSTANAQENTASFRVGWTKLPVQTKLENFRLYCRDARIVLYTKVDLKNINLSEGIWNVASGCGQGAVGKIGIVKAITDPSGVANDFSDHFTACVADTLASETKSIGLYTQNEHASWRRC